MTVSFADRMLCRCIGKGYANADYCQVPEMLQRLAA